jgi:hypothetical protein
MAFPHLALAPSETRAMHLVSDAGDGERVEPGELHEREVGG